jgi:hypothetical protein
MHLDVAPDLEEVFDGGGRIRVFSHTFQGVQDIFTVLLDLCHNGIDVVLNRAQQSFFLAIAFVMLGSVLSPAFPMCKPEIIDWSKIAHDSRAIRQFASDVFISTEFFNGIVFPVVIPLIGGNGIPLFEIRELDLTGCAGVENPLDQPIHDKRHGNSNEPSSKESKHDKTLLLQQIIKPFDRHRRLFRDKAILVPSESEVIFVQTNPPMVTVFRRGSNRTFYTAEMIHLIDPSISAVDRLGNDPDLLPRIELTIRHVSHRV